MPRKILPTTTKVAYHLDLDCRQIARVAAALRGISPTQAIELAVREYFKKEKILIAKREKHGPTD